MSTTRPLLHKVSGNNSRTLRVGRQVGVAVIIHASHPYNSESNSGLRWVLSIFIWLQIFFFVFSLFFSWYSSFRPFLTLCSKVTHGLYSGCQDSSIFFISFYFDLDELRCLCTLRRQWGESFSYIIVCAEPVYRNFGRLVTEFRETLEDFS